MKTKVVYAPQPDEPIESSAAYEYAQRIDSLICADDSSSSDHGNSNAIVVERLTMESLDFLTKGNGGGEKQTYGGHIFIISCSADGSVDRLVRKLIRSLKSNNTCSAGSSTDTCRPKVAIALLGHARCENSANQMKDTIFSHGRKFCKAIRNILEVNDNTNANIVCSTEVQVELEGPDAPGGFGEWVKQIIAH